MFAVVSELLPIEFFFHSCMSSLITREKGISVEKKCSEISKDNETDGCIQGRNLPFSFPDQTTERTILGQVFFLFEHILGQV